MRCLQSGTSELLLEGDRVIRLDWNRDRDLLNLDPLTEQLFNDFPWLVKRVLVPPRTWPACLHGRCSRCRPSP